MHDEYNENKYFSELSKHCYFGFDQHLLCNGTVDHHGKSNKRCTCRCHEKIGDNNEKETMP